MRSLGGAVQFAKGGQKSGHLVPKNINNWWMDRWSKQEGKMYYSNIYRNKAYEKLIKIFTVHIGTIQGGPERMQQL